MNSPSNAPTGSNRLHSRFCQDRIATFTLATLREPLSVDNFEALAVRRVNNDETFVYLLSDDNQSDKQRTLLLQFRARLLRFQTWVK